MTRRSLSFIFGILLAVTVAVYWQSLDNDFVTYDDGFLIQKNERVHHFDPSIFWSYDPELYTPLTLFTYQVNAVLFGVAPWVFHGTSLTLHLLCVFLVFLLLRALKYSDTVTVLGAAIFALHPLQVETVAWASARKEILFTLFSLLTLLLYLRSHRHWDRWILLSLATFFLALLSKVTAALLPLLLILLDWYRVGYINRASIIRTWPYAFLSGIFITIAFFGKGADITLSPWETMLLTLRGVVFYMSRFIVPVGLSIIHPASDTIRFLSVEYGVALLLVLLAAFFMYHSRKWGNGLLMGFLFFLITLLPTFFGYAKAGEIQFASEHYMYMPIIGLIIAVVSSVHTLKKFFISCTKRSRNVHLPFFIFLSWLLALTFLTHQRLYDWRTSESLYQRAFAVYPQSHVAANNLAVEYLGNGKNDEALLLLQQAVEWNPNYAHAYVNLSEALRRKGDYSGSMKASLRALELDPSIEAVYTRSQGMVEDVDIAISVYEARVQADPNDASAWWKLGTLYGQKGMYLEGVKAFQQSISLDPSRQQQSKELQQILQKLQ